MSISKKQKTSRKTFFQMVTAPWFLLGGVLFISVICTLVFILFGIVPKQQELKATDTKIEQLRSQKTFLEKKPAPSKAAQTDIQALFAAVPVKEEQDRLILALKEIQTSSGAAIQKLSFTEQGQDSSPGITLPAPVENQNSGALATKGTSAAGNSAGGRDLLRERRAKLECSGTYVQILDFVGKLYGMERFASVNKWSLEEYKDSGAPADTPLWKITMELSLFTAESYAGKF